MAEKRDLVMDVINATNLVQSFSEVFKQQFENTAEDASPFFQNERKKAFQNFEKYGFPQKNMENWRNTDLSKALSENYTLFTSQPDPKLDIDTIFKCNVPHFETLLLSTLNGWYVSNHGALQTLDNGVVYGSMRAAAKEYAPLVEKYFRTALNDSKEGLIHLNTAMMQDGIFIYVPANVSVDKTFQMVSLINTQENVFLNQRNLIILGENSHLRLAQCDESINNGTTFINSVTEIFMDKSSTLDHYKLQNKDDKTTLINSTYFVQQQGSVLNTNAITLNGALVRNYSNVQLLGSHSEANVYGLYLMDKEQHVDNQVFIHHAVPECQSNELFKGVLDDQASAVFNGHILVARDAQQTNAYQTNRNILLTDKAIIDTKPFLEIYADDVKCSHGATIGQLDAEAMFYIRSRGISEASAKIMLMYAFAAEVLNKISIEELRTRMDDMVKKRLRGELSNCEQCVLNCSNKENKKINFAIDMSKI